MIRKKTISLPPVIFNDIREIADRIKKDLRVLEGKTIVISGAAGFLPSYFVHTLVFANTYLLKKSIKVICVDNFRTGTSDRLLPWKGRSDIKFIARDITKPLNIKEKVDFIIHGASIASPVWYRKFPLETIDVNVGGTRNLLELARRNNSEGFLHLSSSEVYGDPPEKFIPTTEDYWGNVSPTGPRACYDESKRLGETLCMIYFRNFGVPIKIVRPFNVYGPGLRLDDGRVIPDFVKNALRKKPIIILSDGRATRSFCYISDFITANLLLLIHPSKGEAFNIGNDEEISISRLAQKVNQISGSKAGVKFAVSKEKAYLTDNPQRRLPNLAKIKKTIKWSPEISLSEGLKRTLKFYQEGGIR